MRGGWLGLLMTLHCGLALAQSWRVGSFEDSLLAAPFQQLLTEAYGRVGLQPRFEPLPLRRAEQMLLAGELDADLARAEAFTNRHPDLHRVAVPLREVEYVAFGRPPCAARLVPGEPTGLRLALPRGTRVLEGLFPAAQLVQAADGREALRYAQRSMVDLAIVPVTPALRMAAQREGLCAVAEPVLVVRLFHVLHARHAEWAPRLQQALLELEREGRIEQVWRDAERDYLNWGTQPQRR